MSMGMILTVSPERRAMLDRLLSASITAPTTVRNTPVSKAIAVAHSNSSMGGKCR